MLKILSCCAILTLAELKAMQLASELRVDQKAVGQKALEPEDLPAGHPVAANLEKCCEVGMAGVLQYCIRSCSAAELKAMQLASELRVEKKAAGQKIALEPKDLPAGHLAASILAKDCCEVGMAGVLPYCIRFCAAFELDAKAAPVLAVPEQMKLLSRDHPAPILGQKPVEAVKNPGPDGDDDEPPKKTAQ